MKKDSSVMQRIFALFLLLVLALLIILILFVRFFVGTRGDHDPVYFPPDYVVDKTERISFTDRDGQVYICDVDPYGDFGQLMIDARIEAEEDATLEDPMKFDFYTSDRTYRLLADETYSVIWDYRGYTLNKSLGKALADYMRKNGTVGTPGLVVAAASSQAVPQLGEEGAGIDASDMEAWETLTAERDDIPDVTVGGDGNLSLHFDVAENDLTAKIFTVDETGKLLSQANWEVNNGAYLQIREPGHYFVGIIAHWDGKGYTDLQAAYGFYLVKNETVTSIEYAGD